MRRKLRLIFAMVLAVTMLVSVAPMHRTQAEGQCTDAECMTVHSNITNRDEHSEADERGDVTLLEGTPSSYVHLRDDVPRNGVADGQRDGRFRKYGRIYRSLRYGQTELRGAYGILRH